jgi:DNA helicase-2/ATP-dependent DNA helicase PcrA
VFNQWQNNLPSRFIEEIPEDCKEVDGDSGLMAGSQGRAENWSSWGGNWGNSQDSGWNRRKAQFQEREGLSWQTSRTDGGDSDRSYQRGDRVFHDKFGYGDVVITDGDKLEVLFDKAGRKKVVASFVKAVED